MNESILNEVKKMLGIDFSYDAFDDELIPHINSTFSRLTTLGVGPKNGFRITGNTEKWSDFIDENNELNNIKDFMYIKVKLLFDPPQNSFLVNSLESQAKELEWLINVSAEREVNT